MKRLLPWVLLFLLAPAGWAQDVDFRAQLQTNQISLGEQVLVTVRVSGSESNFPNPQVPDVDGLIIQPAGVSRSITAFNTRIASEVQHTYQVVPTRTGQFVIPPFRLRVDAVLYATEELELTVTPRQPAPYTRPSLPPRTFPYSSQPSYPATGQDQRMLFVEAEATPRKVYVNQAIHYVFRLSTAVDLRGNPKYEPLDTTGFISQTMEQKTYRREEDGLDYSVSEVETVLFPTAPGTFMLGPTRVQCELNPYSAFNLLSDLDVASLMRQERVKTLETDPVKVQVVALPVKGRPDSFTGAVGNFTFRVHLDSERARTGEPVTLTAVVEGEGNPELITEVKLPPLPGFKVYETETKSQASESRGTMRGRKTFTTTLVATQPGPKTISGIRFSYFDPETGKYETLQGAELKITVTGPALPEAAATPAEDPGVNEQGLRPIHSQATLERHRLLLEQPAFLFALWVPLAVLVAVYGRLWLRRFRRGNEPAWRRARALATARKGLRQAGEYETIPQFVHGYLADRLTMASKGMSLRQLQSGLEDQGISPETAERLCRLLEAAEGARYAPSQGEGSSEQMAREAGETLARLEEELR